MAGTTDWLRDIPAPDIAQSGTIVEPNRGVINFVGLAVVDNALTGQKDVSNGTNGIVLDQSAGLRQSVDQDTYQDVGAALIDLSATAALGRVVTLEAVLSTNNGAIAAQMRLLNLTVVDTVSMTPSPLVTVSTTPTKVTATITVGGNFPDTSEQLIMFQLRRDPGGGGGGADFVFVDLARILVRYP